MSARHSVCLPVHQMSIHYNNNKTSSRGGGKTIKISFAVTEEEIIRGSAAEIYERISNKIWNSQHVILIHAHLIKSTYFLESVAIKITENLKVTACSGLQQSLRLSFSVHSCCETIT